jgi:hypothetical protein
MNSRMEFITKSRWKKKSITKQLSPSAHCRFLTVTAISYFQSSYLDSSHNRVTSPGN